MQPQEDNGLDGLLSLAWVLSPVLESALTTCGHAYWPENVG